MINVGIDWGRREHYFVVLSEEGDELAKGTVAHSEPALCELRTQLAKLDPRVEHVRMIIEMHTGGLLAWLRKQGYPLFVIAARSSESARDVFRPSGSKDDRHDALTLARLGQMDAACLREVPPPSERARGLLHLLQAREQLVQDKVAIVHRIRAVLAEYSPELSKACNDLNRIWQRELLAAYPSQSQLGQARWEDITAICSRCGKNTMKLLRAAFDTKPILSTPTGMEFAEQDVRWLLEDLETRTQRIAQIEAKLEVLIAEHPNKHLAASLPIRGIVTRATLLGMMDEAGKFTWEELAAHWGVAPVTKQSGSHREVHRRRACDHHICRFLMQFAFNTIGVKGSWAEEYYRSKRPKDKPDTNSKKHYTTLRELAKKWVRILYAMWRDNAEYDEEYHQAKRRAAA